MGYSLKLSMWIIRKNGGESFNKGNSNRKKTNKRKTILLVFFRCAQHGQQLDGESPLWAW